MKECTLDDIKLGIQMTYFIGNNAQENWNLIDASNQNDLWFHLKDQPSAHVVLKMPDGITDKKISKQSILHCAVECKAHSKFSHMSGKSKMKVIYTEIKNVSKAETVGAVHVKQERVVSI